MPPPFCQSKMGAGHFSEELDKENRQYAQSDMPHWGLQTSASNPTWQIANALSPWSRATWSRNCTSECASTTPFSEGSCLQDTGQIKGGYSIVQTSWS